MKEYQDKFPTVFKAVEKELKINEKSDRNRRQYLNGLYDLFPELAKSDYPAACKKVEELVAWIKA